METKSEVIWRDPKCPLTFIEKKGDRYNFTDEGDVYAWDVDYNTLIEACCNSFREKQAERRVW